MMRQPQCSKHVYSYLWRCLWLVLALMFPLASQANDGVEAILADIVASANKGEDALVIAQLPVLIASTDNMQEADYQAINSEVSRLLRQTKQVEATLAVAHYLVSDAARMMRQEVRYLWLMSTSYDLMFFTEFARVGQMLDQELEAIKAWSPTENASKALQANLYHIYGQLLVRQQRVAEALPYFYQAEAWFNAIAKDHPSIFVIQVILGEAFLQAKDYVRAEQFIRKALTIIPKGRVDGISYVKAILASALARQQRPQDALEVIEAYLAHPIDPRRDYFLYFSLVHIDVLRQLQRFESALALAQETFVLAHDVGNNDYLKEATRHLGFLHAYFGNMATAESLLDEAIKFPTDIGQGNPPQAYLDYVEVLTQLGQHESALAYYRRYHEAYVSEYERINQIAIANLEYQQENQRLSQQQALTDAQLALAQMNASRAQWHTQVLMWAAFIMVVILVVILVMLQQLRRKRDQLHKMAIEDQLTGLGNRRAFLQALQERSNQTLIIADIDGLKYYNDHYGHQKGDALIRCYADQLKWVLTAANARLFRIGGDEFAILLPQLESVQQVDHGMSQVLIRTQQQGFMMIGASYGLASRQEVTSDHDWISLADQRMYAMKSMNKSVFC